TVTTAVMLEVYSFRPRSIVERPVPPPMATMCRPFCRLRVLYTCSTRSGAAEGRTASTTELTTLRTPRATPTRPKRIRTTPETTGLTGHSAAQARIFLSQREKTGLFSITTVPVSMASTPSKSRTTQRLTRMPGYNHFSLLTLATPPGKPFRLTVYWRRPDQPRALPRDAAGALRREQQW